MGVDDERLLKGLRPVDRTKRAALAIAINFRQVGLPTDNYVFAGHGYILPSSKRLYLTTV